MRGRRQCELGRARLRGGGEGGCLGRVWSADCECNGGLVAYVTHAGGSATRVLSMKASVMVLKYSCACGAAIRWNLRAHCQRGQGHRGQACAVMRPPMQFMVFQLNLLALNPAFITVLYASDADASGKTVLDA